MIHSKSSNASNYDEGRMTGMIYNVMGRLVGTSDAAGVTTFAYDAFSTLTNETVAGLYAKSLDRYVDGHENSGVCPLN